MDLHLQSLVSDRYRLLELIFRLEEQLYHIKSVFSGPSVHKESKFLLILSLVFMDKDLDNMGIGHELGHNNALRRFMSTYLSCSLAPGMPRAITISQPSSSISFWLRLEGPLSQARLLS